MNDKVSKVDNVSVVTSDEKGVIQSVNTTFVKMFGYTQEESIGKNVSMIMPHQFSNKHDAYMLNYTLSRQKHAVGIKDRRLEAKHKDGSTFPVVIELEELRTTGGSRLFQAKIIALKTQHGLCTVSSGSGVIRSCNQSLSKIFGFRGQSEMVGQRISSLLPEPYQNLLNQGIITIWELFSWTSGNSSKPFNPFTQGKVRKNMFLRHIDGSLFPAQLDVSIVHKKNYDEDDSVVHMESEPESDASAVKKSGDTIWETLQKFRHKNRVTPTDEDSEDEEHPMLAIIIELQIQGLQGVPSPGMISFSKQGIVEFCNPIMLEMIGHRLGDIVGSNISCLIPQNIAAIYRSPHEFW